ncbi:MAG: type II toxin-antitoxin system prevent-host-death family antitoxin [Vicinamibacterales bacterium]|jgi:prevent-host-death family protein|nr:type II toxin-antitoxin system prevent-host-death family antitoxin [Vicinamibacterales bacterium]
MTTVIVADARSRLAEFLRRVEAGETVTIARRNRPIAELRPVEPLLRKPRPAGVCKGEFVVPDDFDAPLPQSVIEGFQGFEKS